MGMIDGLLFDGEMGAEVYSAAADKERRWNPYSQPDRIYDGASVLVKHGQAGIDAFTELRWITLPTAARHYPF